MLRSDYCVECGSLITEDKLCKNCGYQNKDQDEDLKTTDICSGCANPLKSNYKYCPKGGWRSKIPSTIKQTIEDQKKETNNIDFQQVWEDKRSFRFKPSKIKKGLF